MYQDQFVFSQIMTHLPWTTFDRCVQRYRGNRKVRSFRCSQQFRAMAIAQLTHRTSLREIEICLRAHAEKLYHLGFPNGISKSTLAKANEKRNWHIYADFAQRLIASARRLHTHEDFQMDLDQTVYALDSSTIDLCLSLFPWARFRTTKSGIKVHTLLDLQGNIPTFVEITEAKLHDVNILDAMTLEAGSIYVMDRAYLDFERLYELHQLGSFFVIRAKTNTQMRRIYSQRRVDLRPNRVFDRSEYRTTLSGSVKAHQIPRPKPGQDFGISHQQYLFAGTDHRRTVQKPLAC